MSTRLPVIEKGDMEIGFKEIKIKQLEGRVVKAVPDTAGIYSQPAQ